MLYKLNLNEVKFHIIGRTNENPPWRHSGRKTGYNHIIVIVSGTCVCRTENKTYTLCSHDSIFIPENKFYCLETATHCEYYFMCFYADCSQADETDLKKCSSHIPVPDTKFYLPSLDSDNETLCFAEHTELENRLYSHISSNFIKILQLNSTGKYLDRLLIDVYGKEILLLTAAQLFCCEKISEHSHTLEKIKAYINENYTERINAETLSDIFDLSKEHICSIFSSNIGMTVSEYVTSVKLSRAAELLSNSSMNVSQIAEYLGFSSLHYFSRQFKKIYGVPPTKFTSSCVIS